MRNLLKNEILKLFYKRKYLVTILVLAIVSVITCYSTYYTNKQQEKYNNPQTRIAELQQEVDSMKSSADSVSGTDKKNINQKISDLETELEDAKMTANSNTDSQNWKAAMSDEIKRLTENMNNTPDNSDGQKEIIRQQIITYQYMFDHNLKPISSYKTTAYGAMNNLFSALSSFFLIIIVAIISADIVSGEYTPPTMKVLLTKPASRSKVLFSKYLAAVVSSILVIIAIELVTFIVMGGIFGFNESMYPILVGTKYKLATLKSMDFGSNLIPILGSSYIIPHWSFLLRTLLIQSLYIISVVSFCFMLSTILKSSMLSMTLSILVSFAISILSLIPVMSVISPYIFTVYSDISSLLQGNLAQRYNNSAITPLRSIFVFIIWSAVTYLISHITFVKKDILI